MFPDVFRFENNKYSKRGKTNGLLLYGVTLLFETKKTRFFWSYEQTKKTSPEGGLFAFL